MCFMLRFPHFERIRTKLVDALSKVRIPLMAVRGLLKSFLSSVQTKKVYALANDLDLEKSVFIRKRVNFCGPGIVAWT